MEAVSPVREALKAKGAVCVPADTFVGLARVEDVLQRNPTVMELAVPRLEVAPLSTAAEDVSPEAPFVWTTGGATAVVKLRIEPAAKPWPLAHAWK